MSKKLKIIKKTFLPQISPIPLVSAKLVVLCVLLKLPNMPNTQSANDAGPLSG